MKKIKENKLFFGILGLEAVFIIFLLVSCFREPRILAMEASEWEGSSDEIEAGEYEGGYFGVCENEVVGKADEEILHSGAHTLPPGAYDVTVTYRSISDMNQPSKSVKNAAGKLVLFTYKNPAALSSSTIVLDDGHTTLHSRLWVRSGTGLTDFQGKILYHQTGALAIREVKITEAVVFRYVRIAGFLLLFVILDFLYLLFAKQTLLRFSKRKKGIFLGIFGITLFTSMLYFTDSLFYGHDLTFHLERIHALAEGFMEGQVPHRIQTKMLNGYGYVNPLFYGELFLSLPAFLYQLYVPLQDCYKIFVIVLNLLTCAISFHCFSKMAGSWKIGMFGAFLYTASAYRLTDIFVRADVGEFTAMTFLPLLVYGFYRVYTKPDKEKVTFLEYFPIVLALTGILESHNLTCYMLTVFIPLFLLILWKKTFQIQRLLALVKSLLLTVLLNVWYVYPLIESMRMDIKVTKAGTMGKIEQYGAAFFQIFGIFHTATGDSIWDGVKGEMPLTIGIGLTLSLMLLGFLAFQRGTWKLSRNKTYRTAVLFAGIGGLSLFFASAYCPWDTLANLNSGIDQILGTIQFSWRYLEIATVLFTVVMILAVKVLREKAGEKIALIFMCGALLLSLLSEGTFVMNYANESEYKKYYAESELTGFDVGSGMEYILQDTDTEQLNYAEIQVEEGAEEQVTTGKLEIRNGNRYITCKNQGTKDSYVDIPVLHYDNYVAEDKDTGEEILLDTGENNRIRLELPKGYQGTVVVSYEEPKLWRILEIVSLVTFVLLMGYALLSAFRKHSDSKESDTP